MISVNRHLLSILKGFTMAQILLVLSIMNYWTVAQAQNVAMSPDNATLPEKPMKKLIIRDNIATVIDTTTNQTLSVRNLTASTGNLTNENPTTNTGNLTNENFTPKAVINATTTDTLTRNAVNAANSEMPEPENVTIKEKLANTIGNASNINLTAKFDSLQGK